MHEESRLFLTGTFLAGCDFQVKVRIIEATKGEIDGIDVGRLHVGFFYDLPMVLAEFLICEGWAEPVVNFLNLESSPEHAGRFLLSAALGPFRRIF